LVFSGSSRTLSRDRDSLPVQTGWPFTFLDVLSYCGAGAGFSTTLAG
jgi:hypothetical protein